MSATMLPWLLATLALLFAAWLAAPGRLLRTRGYQAARERWLPPAAALVGLAILAVALRDAPPWSARAVLGLLSLCTAAPPLAWAALRLGRRPPGVAGAASAAGAAALPPGGSSGLAGALLLAAAGSLAAACAPHTLPPPGGGLPPALAPAALLLVFGSGGLALGLLVATLSGLVAAGKKVRPGRQSEAALAAGAALLLVAALPGLGGSTLGAGFGLPVITAISGEGPATPLADPAGWPGGSGSASAEPSPLLGEVVAALPSGEEQPVLLPLDAHRLLLRLPVPGMQEALALAALLLGLAMLLALLPLLVPGLLPGSTAASAAMAGRRGEKRSLRWETVAAGICLSAGCGLLLLVVPGSLLAGLLPAAPFPGGEFVATWLQQTLGSSLSSAEIQLSLARVPAELVRFTALGAGLDLAMLLVAGVVAGRSGLGLLLTAGREGEEQQEGGPATVPTAMMTAQRPAPTGAERGLELTVAALAATLLACSLVGDRWWLAGAIGDSRMLLQAIALGLAGLARFGWAHGRPRLAAALLSLAGAALLCGLLAAGRGPLPPALIDVLTMF